VLRRIRRLLGHYRATTPALPVWCERFVTEGYAHYCTLLPTAFAEEDSGVRQVAAMLGFLFTLESLALSLGCDRTQLELAVRQSHPEAPAKVALLWAAQLQLGVLSLADLRTRVEGLLGNPLVVPAFPHYLTGFVHAVEPVPRLAPFVVETLSKAFARLPDPVLLPWLPTLITTLTREAAELVPVLTREAGRTFPDTLAGLTPGPLHGRRATPLLPAPQPPGLRIALPPPPRCWPHTRVPPTRWRAYSGTWRSGPLWTVCRSLSVPALTALPWPPCSPGIGFGAGGGHLARRVTAVRHPLREMWCRQRLKAAVMVGAADA